MLRKEWITNDKGQIEAIWFEHDRVSPVKYEFPGETSRNAAESQDLNRRHLRNTQILAALQQLQSLRASAKQSTPIGSAKGGHWDRFYTILKSVLP